MDMKTVFIKEGFTRLGNLFKSGEEVLKKVTQTKSGVLTEYKVFDKLGNFRNLQRNVTNGKAEWIVVKPSGQVIDSAFRPHSVSINKSGTNFLTDRTDVFISRDGKNIDQIYHEWGGTDPGSYVKNFKTGEYYHSTRPNNITYISPKPWTSLGNIYR